MPLPDRAIDHPEEAVLNGIGVGRRAADQAIPSRSAVSIRPGRREGWQGWCGLAVRGPKVPGAPAIGPCLHPVAGAMVGNGGTAARMEACGLA